MYENCKSAVSVNGAVGEAFDVKVGVHQGSVLSPLIFIIVMEALSKEFRTGLPWELLYANDLVLMAKSIEDLERQFSVWKTGIEEKGLRVNTRKTKVMISSKQERPAAKTGKHPCGICNKGVGRNSIHCKLWIHKGCSGIKGSLTSATNFICTKCLSPPTDDSLPPGTITLAGNELEVVDRFCYLGDMLEANGGAEASSIARVQSGWKKFKDVLPLIDSRGVSLGMKGEIYRTCVRPAMLHGSETWPVRVADTDRLHRAEMSMIRWMCSSKLEDGVPSATLRNRLGGITPIRDYARRRRLGWFGHVERSESDGWLRRACEFETDGTVGRGRPGQTWESVIDNDLRSMNLDRTLH